jgi:hypothetical protein
MGFFVRMCLGIDVREPRLDRNEGNAAMWLNGGAKEKSRSNKLSNRARRMPAARFSESTANLAITHFGVHSGPTGTYMIDDTGSFSGTCPFTKPKYGTKRYRGSSLRRAKV